MAFDADEAPDDGLMRLTFTDKDNPDKPLEFSVPNQSLTELSKEGQKAFFATLRRFAGNIINDQAPDEADFAALLAVEGASLGIATREFDYRLTNMGNDVGITEYTYPE